MLPTPLLARVGFRVCLLPLTLCAAFAQVPSPVTRCQVTSSPVTVRSEGLTERMGDVVLQCVATPGAPFSGNLTLYLPVPITNRVDSGNMTTGAVLSVDLGSGFVPTGIAGRVSGNNVAFTGVSYNVPSGGTFSLRISNLRAAMNGLGARTSSPSEVMATLASNLPVDRSQFIVAYSQTGFLSSMSSTGVSCYGSPSPATLDLPGLFAAGTALASTRVTEGFASAFEPRAAGADSGTRFLVKYSGFPDAAHLYIPDAVAGSTALKPTAGGDLNLPQAVGQYVPGSNSLLLVRVNGADSTGAGGLSVAALQGTSPVTLSSVSEVALNNGGGYAVYEVVDANPNVQESAQFPTFISLPRYTPPAVANETISLAPLSSVATASMLAPIPRFAAVDAVSDCAVAGDCAAPVVLVPKLSLEATPIKLTAVASGGAMTSAAGKFLVHNEGGGTMDWTTQIIYDQGSAWLSLSSASGSNEGTVQVTPQTKALAAGTYQATIIVNAGTAGRQSVPVTLTVTPAAAPPPLTPAITVGKVLNAATLETAPLIPGSLTTLMGSHFSGKNVAVTFDGLSAALIYIGESQINLVVPAALAGKTSASLIVTVDGESSAPVAVPVAAAWPAIFAHGVLNQDSRENLPQTPAKSGDILQIYATGIPKLATVSVQLGGVKSLVPVYAGEAPNVPGVQQVNVAVPDGLSGAAGLKLCAATAGQEYCSPEVQVSVR